MNSKFILKLFIFKALISKCYFQDILYYKVFNFTIFSKHLCLNYCKFQCSLSNSYFNVFIFSKRLIFKCNCETYFQSKYFQSVHFRSSSSFLLNILRASDYLFSPHPKHSYTHHPNHSQIMQLSGTNSAILSMPTAITSTLTIQAYC